MSRKSLVTGPNPATQAAPDEPVRHGHRAGLLIRGIPMGDSVVSRTHATRKIGGMTMTSVTETFPGDAKSPDTQTISTDEPATAGLLVRF